MLLALRDYIAKEKYVSLEQLARAFRVSTTALEPMLEVWIARGVIMQIRDMKTCAVACLGCHFEAVKYYGFVLD